MSEYYSVTEEKRKKPTFLIILLILTSLSLLSTFFAGVIPLVSGPMNDEQLEQEEVNLAKTKKDLERLFGDEEIYETLSDSLDLSFAKVSYIQKSAFWIFHLFQLLTFSLGAAAVYYMYHLRKLGFHLYIVYCLVSIGQAYLIFPKELIVGAEIIGGFSTSALFVLLYALNLKHFNESGEDDSDSYQYSN
jgi:hypothetical protein